MNCMIFFWNYDPPRYPGIPISVICLFQLYLVVAADSHCKFPPELRGRWISSTSGELFFKTSQIKGLDPCLERHMCTSNVTKKWTCMKRKNDGYGIRTGLWSKQVNLTPKYTHVFACIYLQRVSQSIYIYNIGFKVTEKANFPYILVRKKGKVPNFENICDWNVTPYGQRLLFRKSYIPDLTNETARKIPNICPPSISNGDFIVESEDCETRMSTCKTISLNGTCIPSVFQKAVSGGLKCIFTQKYKRIYFTMLFYFDDQVHPPQRHNIFCLLTVKDGYVAYANMRQYKCDNIPRPHFLKSDMLLTRLNYGCEESDDYPWLIRGQERIRLDLYTGCKVPVSPSYWFVLVVLSKAIWLN